ncbi:MAG: phytanoyl-CoA dioxygenase family protein [Gammaproteobacteria bacterium]|nr:phytanoyl-CoA dioxygenase family protein [Gammaproteobacteria bacterium]
MPEHQHNHALDSEQQQRYAQQGYLAGLKIFSEAEASTEREKFESLEQRGEELDLPKPVSSYLRANAQYVSVQVAELVRHPAILGAVSSLLGKDLLVWSTEFFIKEAGTQKVVSWHQDLTYWGLGSTEGEMTAWLALSPATPESGCMRFLPGSHRYDLLKHRDTFADSNLLSRGQELEVDVDESKAVDILLRPGEMSLHHGRIFHSSGPNVSNDRRIGLAIRYLRPDVKQLVAEKDYAILVKGWDRFNHFIPVAPPLRDFDPDYLARREEIMAEQSAALSQGATQQLKRV